MSEILSPGVFIEEIASNNQVIQSVGTSTMAVPGWTTKGLTNKATLVTSMDSYSRKFGEFTKDSRVPMSVAAYFANGGTRVYVVRVAPSDAVSATIDITESATVLWTVNAASVGIHGNDLKATLKGNSNYFVYGLVGSSANVGKYTKFDFVVSQLNAAGAYEVKETYEELEMTDATDPMYFSEVINDASDLVSVVEGTAGYPTAFDSTVHTAVAQTLAPTPNGTLKAFTTSLTSGHCPIVKTSLALTLTISAAASVYHADVNGNLTNVSGAATLDLTKTNTVNYTTGAIVLNFTAGPATGATLAATYLSMPSTGISYTLASGADGTLTNVNRTLLTAPTLSTTKSGMYALDRVDEMMQLIVPDLAGDTTSAGDQIDYCEARRDVFAILCTPSGYSADNAVDYRRVSFNRSSKYAAMYWPWVKIADPLNNNRPTVMPPLAHIAGVYARTDVKKNVGKAPGGTVDGALRFLTGLEHDPDKGERDSVSPTGINTLINTPQTGMCVWGVRTMSNESDWRYINATRLFMFVEKSVFNSTHWAVFESIGTGLYTRIKTQLDGFMNNLYSTGHFAGRTASEAYFVICDASNNPASVVDAGQVVVDVGMAPNKPGEFIRFRFSQKTLA